MKKYLITVNGKTYDITVEEVGGSTSQRTAAHPLPPAAPVSALKAAVVKQVDGCSTKIVAPMPGKIIAINVNVGDSVTNGQELIVMEAMKMHNPVLASTKGVVKEILVQAGDAVQAGSVLAIIG